MTTTNDHRSTKRPAGGTRLPAPTQTADPSRLSAIDVTGFTRNELVRALTDRGLAATGTDTQLRTRLSNDVNGV